MVAATELDERTLRSLARGINHPHARTLHKLAQGLGVSIDELFQPVARSRSPRQFDRATNSLVESVRRATCEQCSATGPQADFDELYSRFGTGGQLTEEGVLAAAEAMNAKRDCGGKSASSWKAAKPSCWRNSSTCFFAEPLHRSMLIRSLCSSRTAASNASMRILTSPAGGKRLPPCY